MFILTTISDLIQISPEDFSKFSAIAIEDNINEKYANKVIQKIGLCIGFYDLLESSDGLIGHGTGLVHVNVRFRLIVFRPFKGEIILGKISSATEHGIKIGVEFFNDILVPPELLLDGARFDYADQVWVWENEGSTFYFDIGEVVRFRVETEEWHDQIPNAPDRGDGTVTEREPPYSIIVCLSGLDADGRVGPHLVVVARISGFDGTWKGKGMCYVQLTMYRQGAMNWIRLQQGNVLLNRKILGHLGDMPDFRFQIP